MNYVYVLIDDCCSVSCFYDKEKAYQEAKDILEYHGKRFSYSQEEIDKSLKEFEEEFNQYDNFSGKLGDCFVDVSHTPIE